MQNIKLILLFLFISCDFRTSGKIKLTYEDKVKFRSLDKGQKQIFIECVQENKIRDCFLKLEK